MMNTRKITGEDLCTGGIVRVSLTGTGPAGHGEYDLDDWQPVFDGVAGHTNYMTAHRLFVLMEAHGRHGVRVPGGNGYLKWTPNMHIEIDPDETVSPYLFASFEALSGVTVTVEYADGECMIGPLLGRHTIATKHGREVYRIIRLPPVLQTAAEAVIDSEANE